jgi:hypothetical protein
MHMAVRPRFQHDTVPTIRSSAAIAIAATIV